MDAIDPGDHTVNELEAVLPDIDDVEILEVLLERERDGEDRKTAVDAIESRLEAVASPDPDQPANDPTDSPDHQSGPGSTEDDAASDSTASSEEGVNQPSEETTENAQVLTFTLNDETYCVGIDHVTEIVEAGDVTSIPNSPNHVEGMMDLRGETTTIIDPRGPLGIETNGSENGNGDRIVVFDPDGFNGSATGWTVDEVHNVLRISTADVDSGPAENDGVHGVVKQDGEFLIWVSPEALTG